MSEKTQLEEQEAIVTFSQNSWDGQRIEGSSAVNALEQGKVLFFPHLAFTLSAQQQRLLDPALVDPKKKNISYSVGNHLIKGVADAAVEPQIRKLLESYYQSCSALISSVLHSINTFCVSRLTACACIRFLFHAIIAPGAKTIAACTLMLSLPVPTMVSVFYGSSPILILTAKTACGELGNLSRSWRQDCYPSCHRIHRGKAGCWKKSASLKASAATMII